MSKETPKQKLRRLLDRLEVDGNIRREVDKFIEEMPDDEADGFVRWLDDLERESPGLIGQALEELAKQGSDPDA